MSIAAIGATDILEFIQRNTPYTYRRVTAKEFAGPCPFCRDGDDRFRIWPDKDRYWCRHCNAKGDSIQFARDYLKVPFAQACELAGAPGKQGRPLPAKTPNHRQSSRTPSVNTTPKVAPAIAWCTRAQRFVDECREHLFNEEVGYRALNYLHGRLLTDTILWTYGVGLNPADVYEARSSWGLEAADPTKPNLWLPKGVVIPWYCDGDLWGVRIRRPEGDPKYYWVPGGTLGLYKADDIVPGYPVILVEGEFDALILHEQAYGKAISVATGSTHGARAIRWIARLSSASAVLVAFDHDKAGDEAAEYWCKALPNAMRWRPYWSDANGLARDGVFLADWVQSGLETAARKGILRPH